MTLAEMLLMLREAILNDRTDRVAGTPDYLWTDELLVQFLNEAHLQYAVQSLSIHDGTTDVVTKLVLSEGVTEYPLHSSILAVKSARVIGAAVDLGRVGHVWLHGSRLPVADACWQRQFEVALPGAPRAFSTDEYLGFSGGTAEAATLQVYPTPAAAQEGVGIRLRVIRKPLVRFSLANPDAEPEIAEEHQMELLDHAAYLALRIVDDDAGAARRALEFKAMFDGNVRRARNEVMRKLFAPSQWGFGRNGFSWEG